MAFTTRDSDILAKLFDPEGQSCGAEIINDKGSIPSLPEAEFVDLSQRERDAILLLNEAHPSEEAIRRCIEMLGAIISAQPQYASALVNRAQAHRMLIPFDKLFVETGQEDTIAIMDDLQHAIRLIDASGPMTGYQAKVLAAAHTHRGLLLLRAADILRSGASVYGLGSELIAPGADGLEEEGSNELAKGGRYGNATAQQLSIMTNPYAKMCGEIVKEAHRQEIKDYAQTQT